MTNVLVSTDCSLWVEQQSLINLQTYNIIFHRILLLYFFIFQVTLVFTLAYLYISYIFIDAFDTILIKYHQVYIYYLVKILTFISFSS